MTLILSLGILLFVFSADVHAQSGPCPGGLPLAFEGAEGAGKCTQGGRGGPVIDITNLNDSGSGSLRNCLEVMSGPRICRAVVAGWVSGHGEDIVIRNPNVTFDGSAAQIGIKDGGLMVRANETIIRHLRVRPGLYAMEQRQPPQNANGIFYMSTEAGVPTHEHYLDHASISWGNDDLLGVIFGATNVTIDHSIIAEALECSFCGGKGFGMGGTLMKVSVLRSLSANTWIRWPEITAGSADFVNTVAYNDNGIPAQINPIYGNIHINFVGNTFKWGPNIYNTQYAPIRAEGGITYSNSSDIFVQDNKGHWWDANQVEHDSIATPDSRIIWGNNGGIPVRSTRYSDGLPLLPTMPSAEAYDYVLDNAGAMPRDATDARIVSEVRNNTGSWKTSVANAGGWPTLTGGTPPPLPQCQDGLDNDQDGMIDYPADSGCSGLTDNDETNVVTPPPPPPDTYTVTATSPITPGSTVAVPWTAPSGHSTQDWITFVLAGAGPQDYMNGWAYVPSGTSGNVSLVAPTTEGSYQLRYYLNDGFEIAYSQLVTVGGGTPPPPPPPPAAQCQDGLDNDTDGLIDYPADPGCVDPVDTDESNLANRFTDVTNVGKVLTFKYVPAECPSGVTKATGPLVGGKRTITMTCKP